MKKINFNNILYIVERKNNYVLLEDEGRGFILGRKINDEFFIGFIPYKKCTDEPNLREVIPLGGFLWDGIPLDAMIIYLSDSQGGNWEVRYEKETSFYIERKQFE